MSLREQIFETLLKSTVEDWSEEKTADAILDLKVVTGYKWEDSVRCMGSAIPTTKTLRELEEG